MNADVIITKNISKTYGKGDIKVHALSFGDLNDPKSEIRHLLSERFSARRKAELGTEPKVYYLI